MTAKPKNRYWVWFFAFVLLASVGVAVFLIVFNLRMQLKPEQLEAAQQRWKEHGPSDYRLTYLKKINDNSHADKFVVTVRDGKVVDVVMNDDLHLEPERRPYHGMDRLLRDIERFQELDAKAGRKVYVTAIFDDKTGAMLRYVRRVMGTTERVQLDARVEPLP